MASKKAGGTAKNLRDSKPKYLGVKLYEGESAWPGKVIIRQRGTEFAPGRNVGMGKDHTLFALSEGKVQFRSKRKISFNGKTKKQNIVDVL